jgi:hypothetical protein
VDRRFLGGFAFGLQALEFGDGFGALAVDNWVLARLAASWAGEMGPIGGASGRPVADAPGSVGFLDIRESS